MWPILTKNFNMSNKWSNFFAGIGCLAFLILSVKAIVDNSNRPEKSAYIYNQLSNDNWGTSTDRDSIKEEYSVILTKDSLTITELVPGSIFFKRMVRDTSVKTVSFAINNGGYKTSEYWANIVGADKKLKAFDQNSSGAYVMATSSIVRIVVGVEGWVWEETYYFWPSSTVK